MARAGDVNADALVGGGCRDGPFGDPFSPRGFTEADAVGQARRRFQKDFIGCLISRWG